MKNIEKLPDTGPEKSAIYYKPDGEKVEIESSFYFDVFGYCQEYILMDQFEFMGEWWALNATSGMSDWAITHVETGFIAFRSDEEKVIISEFKKRMNEVGVYKLKLVIHNAFSNHRAFGLL